MAVEFSFYCRYSHYLSGNCCFCNSLWLWQNAFQIPRPYLLYSNGDFYVPGVVNLIPSYKIIETFGWVNSSLAMIIPGLAGMGNIFLVRQFMKGIPLEFDESARMDGADEFTIFLRSSFR